MSASQWVRRARVRFWLLASDLWPDTPVPALRAASRVCGVVRSVRMHGSTAEVEAVEAAYRGVVRALHVAIRGEPCA